MSKKHPLTTGNIIVTLLVVGSVSGAYSHLFLSPTAGQRYLWLTVICYLAAGVLKLPQWIASARSKLWRRQAENYHPEDVAAVRSLLSRSNRVELQAISNEPNPANWNDSVYLRLGWEGRPYLRAKTLCMDGAKIDGDLEAPHMPELQWLSLTDNPNLTSLRGLEKLPKLGSLWVNNTRLTELNLKGNPALTTLLADRTKLAALDLSGNPALKQLNLSRVSLARLDLTGLNKLWHLDIGSPRLTRLEMSSLPDLKSMYLVCPALSEFDLPPLPLLDDLIFEAPVNKLDLSHSPQLRRLIISKSHIEELKLEHLPGLKTLNLSDLPLTELMIERIRELETLCLSSLPLSTLNLASNTSLKWIELKNMPIASVDLSGNHLLENLYVCDLPLPVIDVSANHSLSTLEINAVPITSLDVSTNTKLKRLSVNKTNLTNLDVSANLELTWLDVSANPLTGLDISRNKELAYLLVKNSPLVGLDLSHNKQLLWLLASGSSLTELDLTHNRRLKQLAVDASGLKQVKIAHKLQWLSTDQETPQIFADNFPGTDFLCWQGACSSLVEWLSSPIKQTLASNYKIANLDNITADINVDLDDLPAEPLLAGRAYPLSDLSPKLESDLLKAKDTGQHFALLSFLGNIDLDLETRQLTFHDEGIQQLKLVLDGHLELRLNYSDNFTIKNDRES